MSGDMAALRRRVLALPSSPPRAWGDRPREETVAKDVLRNGVLESYRPVAAKRLARDLDAPGSTLAS